jgi:hypothetical protein
MLCHVGDYAKAERVMPFEALIGEQVEIMNSVNLYHSGARGVCCGCFDRDQGLACVVL